MTSNVNLLSPTVPLSWSSLPPEHLKRIGTFLNPHDARVIPCVCKTWNEGLQRDIVSSATQGTLPVDPETERFDRAMSNRLISELPNDLVRESLLFLDIPSIALATCVNCSWRFQILGDKEFWKVVLMDNYFIDMRGLVLPEDYTLNTYLQFIGPRLVNSLEELMERVRILVAKTPFNKKIEWICKITKSPGCQIWGSFFHAKGRMTEEQVISAPLAPHNNLFFLLQALPVLIEPNANLPRGGQLYFQRDPLVIFDNPSRCCSTYTSRCAVGGLFPPTNDGGELQQRVSSTLKTQLRKTELDDLRQSRCKEMTRIAKICIFMLLLAAFIYEVNLYKVE